MQRILVTEDNKDIRQVMIAYFEKVPGFVVNGAADGLEAITLCEQGKEFDVLLTTCNMPHLSGIGLIPKVKKLLPNIRTILMSYDEYDAQAKVQIGADHIVDKKALDLNVLKVMIKGL